MTSILEKGGGSAEGIKLLLCENPLPPIDAAIEAARAELPHGNYYTEPFSAPLRRQIARDLSVPERLVHINAGSELILRQLFQRLGQQVHLLMPTYPLFPEIAARYTVTRLLPETDFRFNLADLELPEGTTLAVIVNPSNPNGATFDTAALPDLLARHPKTHFLVDEAFIGLAGQSVAPLVPDHHNLLVTRTLSKAHSLAGFRVGYAILPPHLADELAAMGVRTYPTETYFFLADFAPHDAGDLAIRLGQRGIHIKALGDPELGPGFMRVTTALPEDNQRFLRVLREIL